MSATLATLEAAMHEFGIAVENNLQGAGGTVHVNVSTHNDRVNVMFTATAKLDPCVLSFPLDVEMLTRDPELGLRALVAEHVQPFADKLAKASAAATVAWHDAINAT